MSECFHLRVYRFNTQPPEGGWRTVSQSRNKTRSFNTQPPEGGWRRPAAKCDAGRSFNTQPPEGGWSFRWRTAAKMRRFQHTAARRRLALDTLKIKGEAAMFQHTAARRRLAAPQRKTCR